MSEQPAADVRTKVRSLPTTAGVYLMKDALGRVIYVGKAVNLRGRVSSYFNSKAAFDRRISDLVPEIRDVDHIGCDSEVEALLLEARLIKDIQPRFNSELKDDKTFPYLQITTREEFPRIEFTRKPRTRGAKLYGPFTSAKRLRGAISVLQRIFRFRTCSLDIAEGEERWRWFRPCLLASIGQCTAPCNLRISKEDYRRDIRRLCMVLDGKKSKLLRELRAEMLTASQELRFERGPHSGRNDRARNAQPAWQLERPRAAGSLSDRPEEGDAWADENVEPRQTAAAN